MPDPIHPASASRVAHDLAQSLRRMIETRPIDAGELAALQFRPRRWNKLSRRPLDKLVARLARGKSKKWGPFAWKLQAANRELPMVEQPELAPRIEETVSTGQACRVIKRKLGRSLSRKTVVRLIESGELQAFRLHKNAHWSIDSASLQQYIQRVRKMPPN
jgi:hypothetical protein